MGAAGGGKELLLEVLDVAAVGADAPLQRIHPMILHPKLPQVKRRTDEEEMQRPWGVRLW